MEAVIELSERVPLTAKQTLFCFDILLTSCNDYKTDKRGDTGSWCRASALHGMERLLYATYRIIPSNVPSNIGECSAKTVLSQESSAFEIGMTVMTSYGLGKIIDSSDYSYSTIKNNESIAIRGTLGADSKNAVLIQFPTGSLGYFFTVDAFQVKCLPPGAVLVHRSGLQILKGHNTAEFALPSPLPLFQESILECSSNNSNHQLSNNKNRSESEYGNDDESKNKNEKKNNSESNVSDGDEKHMESILSFEESSVLVPRIIAAMLKQLCEKLDSIRGVAGNCLENVLCSKNPFIPFISDRDILCKIIKGSKYFMGDETGEKVNKKEINNENVNENGDGHSSHGFNNNHNNSSSSSSSSNNKNNNNGNSSSSSSDDNNDNSSSSCNVINRIRNEWSNPNYVFPLVTNIMRSSPIYFEDILSGLIVSVGGLSEQVVKESSDALLKLCTRWTEEKNISNIGKIADSLLLFFSKFKSDDRVIIPLLKTTEYLLRSGVLNSSSLRPVCCSFYTVLIECIGLEQKGTSDVGKIRTCVDLYLLLLQVEEPVRSTALKNMLLLLGHKVCSLLFCFRIFCSLFLCSILLSSLLVSSHMIFFLLFSPLFPCTALFCAHLFCSDFI